MLSKPVQALSTSWPCQRHIAVSVVPLLGSADSAFRKIRIASRLQNFGELLQFNYDSLDTRVSGYVIGWFRVEL